MLILRYIIAEYILAITVQHICEFDSSLGFSGRHSALTCDCQTHSFIFLAPPRCWTFYSFSRDVPWKCHCWVGVHRIRLTHGGQTRRSVALKIVIKLPQIHLKCPSAEKICYECNEFFHILALEIHKKWHSTLYKISDFCWALTVPIARTRVSTPLNFCGGLVPKGSPWIFKFCQPPTPLPRKFWPTPEVHEYWS